LNNPSLHYIGAGKIAPTGDHANCERFWENIKAQHAATYGPNSAYNFSACNAHGIRMEGRGWNRDSAANGQENGVNYNPGSRALVMLIGADDVITPQLERAVAAFADEAIRYHGMEHPLKAHSDLVATGCCGDNGRAVVAAYNAGTLEGDDVTEEQMNTLGAWMQEQRGLLENTLGKWEQDTRSYVDKQIKASEARIIAALK
jgi:hypothetical protein